MDDIPRAFLDLLLQIAYRVRVDFEPMLSDPTRVSCRRMSWNVFTYIEVDAFSRLGDLCGRSLWAWGGGGISGSGSWWFGDEIDERRSIDRQAELRW